MNQPRLAQKQDVPRILELIQELATFEKEADAVELSVSQLEEDGFGEQPKFTCFVLEVENKIEGMALVYPRYSTWKGEVLHLEDLIVSEAKRGQGLGTKLLDKVIRYAKQLGVKRVSWEVLDWNDPAIKFYESKGANVMRDWDVVQLDEQGIEHYLNNIN
ncbi:acetyltransferase (GNAT) family protein [Winogradskyella epiphytica]|uniref:Acetyltransferase (GNAT) family protein n=1 Tax=Winogradskyella epiphytica TaxID=262005 RepID=A0A2V4X1C3_9FLAO|nr:GNAT family N-acetyltransferase [Winogradskyella epiphytica]PYE83478.1 acetyltransferase (GNAT) family protein [Winogradskyella epiphytica]GGW58474.1 N-acetyltransferase [Winogradskyella epiphytica]